MERTVHVHALAPVVAIDLDGTLADYYRHFCWYLENIYRPHAGRHIPDWTKTPNGEFSEALGMDKAEYRDAKLAYRQGGLKRSIPLLLRDDVDYLQRIRSKLGVQVWITTNRPWLRLDNIDKDTLYWIDHNLGEVDGVIFSQNKYQDLIDHVGRARILGVIDDLPENIMAAEELNIPGITRYGPHNTWWLESHGWNKTVVTTIIEFYSYVKMWKGEWDAEHPGILQVGS